jgi:hypothetical protein
MLEGVSNTPMDRFEEAGLSRVVRSEQDRERPQLNGHALEGPEVFDPDLGDH